MLLTLFKLATTIYTITFFPSCGPAANDFVQHNNLRPFPVPISLASPAPPHTRVTAVAARFGSVFLSRSPAVSDDDDAAAPVNFVIVHRIKTDIIKENYSFRVRYIGR